MQELRETTYAQRHRARRARADFRFRNQDGRYDRLEDDYATHVPKIIPREISKKFFDFQKALYSFDTANQEKVRVVEMLIDNYLDDEEVANNCNACRRFNQYQCQRLFRGLSIDRNLTCEDFREEFQEMSPHVENIRKLGDIHQDKVSIHLHIGTHLPGLEEDFGGNALLSLQPCIQHLGVTECLRYLVYSGSYLEIRITRSQPQKQVGGSKDNEEIVLSLKYKPGSSQILVYSKCGQYAECVLQGFECVGLFVSMYSQMQIDQQVSQKILKGRLSGLLLFLLSQGTDHPYIEAKIDQSSKWYTY